MSRSFQQRLKSVMCGGNLTLADAARWFDRPHCTIRQWALGTRPGRSPADVEDAELRLVTLEGLLKRRKLPVPRGLSPKARIEWLAGVRKEVKF